MESRPQPLEYKDFLGQEIEVGDTIVYPVRWGSSMWLSKTKVLERTETTSYYGPHKAALKVKGKSKNWYTKEERPYVRTVHRLDRVVVVEKGDKE